MRLLHRWRSLTVCAIATVLFCSRLASAHPHSFMKTTVTFQFDPEGLKEIQLEWELDEIASAIWIDTWDENQDKTLSDEEMGRLRMEWLQLLADKHYYCDLAIDGREIKPVEVEHCDISLCDKSLWLEFAVPCRVEAGEGVREVRLAQYDPEYYMAFEFSDLEALTLGDEGAPTRLFIRQSPTITYYEGTMIPEELVLRIGEEKGGGSGGKAALSPLSDPAHPRAPYAVRRPLSSRVKAWLVQTQRDLQKSVENRLSSRSGGEPGSMLGICFIALLYGVVHAVGPGHGKTITAAWLAGKTEALVKGVTFGVVLSFVHAASGLAVVLIGRFILEKTAMTAVGHADKPLKMISFTLIALMGAFMLGRELLAMRKRNKTKPPEELDSPPSEKTANKGDVVLWPAIAAGLTPCPAVVLVALFCSATGRVWLGVLLAACVAAGMALTTATTAALVVAIQKAALMKLRDAESKAAQVEKILRLGGGTAVLLTGSFFLWMTLTQ